MPKLPGVSHRRAVKAFEKAGFWVVREGKHISMTDGERIIIIPRAKREEHWPMLDISHLTPEARPICLSPLTLSVFEKRENRSLRNTHHATR